MAKVKPVVLVVDDELSIRESFSLILGKEFNVITAASGEAALKKLIDEKVDLVYLDIRMPGLNGIETLKRIKQIDKGTDVIMVTAVNDVGSASSAVKFGAKDYIVKPFDVNDILSRTRSLMIRSETKKIQTLEKKELISLSRQIANIKKTLEEISTKEVSVLLYGEKGSEDEIIADIIASECEKRITQLNASEDIKLPYLFGREKGSFTGAFVKEVGLLEEANGGILFIKNIELLPRDVQAKLAESLSKKELSREGSFSKVPLDLRLIAETSVNLKELVKNGLFDKGLYDIVSGAVIEVPSLRERPGDIPLLVKHYAGIFEGKYNKRISFSDEALEVLSNYTWPGNVTELSNVVESIALACGKEEVLPDALPLDILMNSPITGNQYSTLEHISGNLEREHILAVYDRAGGDKEKTANMLGIQLSALESKLESYPS